MARSDTRGTTGYLYRGALHEFAGYMARCPYCHSTVVAKFAKPGFDDIAQNGRGRVEKRLCEHVHDEAKYAGEGTVEFTFTYTGWR